MDKMATERLLRLVREGIIGRAVYLLLAIVGCSRFIAVLVAIGTLLVAVGDRGRRGVFSGKET